MITIPLKIKPVEIKEYVHVIQFHISTLEANEYLHFYNLRSLLKRFIDKSFSLNPASKAVTIRININEYESLKQCASGTALDPYYNALLWDFIQQIDKQINNTRYLPNL